VLPLLLDDAGGAGALVSVFVSLFVSDLLASAGLALLSDTPLLFDSEFLEAGLDEE
jgi:hypothetical protein